MSEGRTKKLSEGGEAASSRYGYPRTLEALALGERSAVEDAEIAGLDPLVADAPNPGYAALIQEDALVGKPQPGSTMDLQRGSKRETAYRKAQKPRPSVEKRVQGKRRAIVARALNSGATPLDVMLDNMRWASVKAHKLEQAAQGIEDKTTFEDVCRLREMADASAYRAAPYLHAKLAPVVPKGEKAMTINFIIEDA